MLNDIKKLAIVGAGGHGKVVCDAAACTKQFDEIVFIDGRAEFMDNVMGFSVVGDDDVIPQLLGEFLFIVAIGNNAIRANNLEKLKKMGAQIATIVHPSATISSFSHIGEGTVVFANAVINAESRLGEGVIVNTGSIIEHDCVVGDYAHVAPNATMTGGSRLGDFCLLGTNACMLPLTEVGANTIVGAGSVVHKSWQECRAIAGVPAKPIN